MAINNGIITAPIQIPKVSNFFGTKPSIMNVCTASIINKWSKYKPFRSTALGFDVFNGDSGTITTNRDKALEAAGYGFKETPANTNTIFTPAIHFTEGVMDNVYSNFTYYKPDGTTYPGRLDDFIDYRHTAVIGFSMTLPTAYYDSVNGALIGFGSMGNSLYDYRCLAPQDIMPSLGNMMVGVLLSKPDSANKYFISTGKTLNQLKNTFGIAYFAGQEVTNVDSDISYAIVPELAGNWKNKEIVIAAILAPAAYSDPSQCYTFNSAWSDCYSLEFEKNLDRVTLPVTRNTTGMDMTKLNITRTTTPTATHSLKDDWHYYSAISKLAFSVEALTGWATTAKTVYYQLTISENSGGGMFINSASSTTPINNPFAEGTITITSGQTKNIEYTFDTSLIMKVYKEFHTAALNVKLVLSTEENGKGSTKIFTDVITLGTW